MAKPYPNDLRIRVVQAVQNQEESQRQIAKRFGVSLSFVRDLLRQVRETGSIQPKPHGGAPITKITPAELEVIRQLASLSNDATLDELCERFYQQTQIKVSRPTLCRALQKLQLARRKTVHLNQQDTPVVFSSSRTESKPIEEGRSTKAEGFMFRSDEDSIPPEREPLNGGSVGVLNPCSLRSRADDKSQNSLLPSASCPLPFPDKL